MSKAWKSRKLFSKAPLLPDNETLHRNGFIHKIFHMISHGFPFQSFAKFHDKFTTINSSTLITHASHLSPLTPECFVQASSSSSLRLRFDMENVFFLETCNLHSCFSEWYSPRKHFFLLTTHGCENTLRFYANWEFHFSKDWATVSPLLKLCTALRLSFSALHFNQEMIMQDLTVSLALPQQMHRCVVIERRWALSEEETRMVGKGVN